MSAIKEAMRKAGVDTRPPTERLEEICINAMVHHATDTEKVLLEIWHKVKVDHNLTLALLQGEWRRCAQALLYNTRNRLSYMENQNTEKSPVILKAIKVHKVWKVRENEQVRSREAEQQRAQAKADREWREHIESWTQTAAAHVVVGEKRFWEASVSDINHNLTERQHESKFLKMLIQNVPDDGRPISYYRKPDEINAIWQRASSL